MKFQIKQKLNLLIALPLVAFACMIGFAIDSGMDVKDLTAKVDYEFASYQASKTITEGYDAIVNTTVMLHQGKTTVVAGKAEVAIADRQIRAQEELLRDLRRQGDVKYPVSYINAMDDARQGSQKLKAAVSQLKNQLTNLQYSKKPSKFQFNDVQIKLVTALTEYEQGARIMQILHEKRWNAAGEIKKTKVENTISVLVWVSSICAVFLVALGWWINSSIAKSIDMVKETIEDAAKALDLSLKIPMTNTELDAIANSFNTLMGHCSATLAAIREVTASINVTADNLNDLSASGETTVGSTREQAELAASAITEMSASIEQIAQNVSESESASNACTDEAQQVSSLTNNNLQITEHLVSRVKESTEKMRELDVSVEGIAKMMSVITDIAEATNLLALNAAIEAARAGEHGRGFAVVADEVRKLSASTKESAAEIATTIDSLRESSSEGVSCNNEALEVAVENLTALERCANAITTLSGNIGVIHDMNTQVATAIEEQACVSREIHSGAEAINTLTNTSAGDAHSTLTASRELANLAHKLNEQVERFKV